MGRVLSILGSISLGLILAGVGVLINAWSLIYGGLAIFVLMVALWLYTWARPIKVEVPVHVPAPPLEPEPVETKARAVWALKRARDNAAVALHQGTALTNERAYNEVRAALLTIRREFGFGTLSLSGKGSVPFPSLLKVLIRYMDQLIPLLREGHLEEAKRVATSFGWRWQDEVEGIDAVIKSDPAFATFFSRSSQRCSSSSAPCSRAASLNLSD